MDLYEELQQKRRELDRCIHMLRQTGTELGEAERAYKVRLREWALRLKSQGMAVGMISLTVYGVPEVADARFERDRCEAIYTANKEAVMSCKLQLRLLDNQISREYASPQADM